MKQKLLVLENLHEVEDVCGHFAMSNFPKETWDHEVLYGLGKQDPKEIFAKVCSSDAVLTQSTLANRDQFQKMLTLLIAAAKVKPFEFYFIFSHDDFLTRLNVDLSDSVAQVIELLSLTKVYEVVREVKESYSKEESAQYFSTQEKKYFKKLLYFTDAVPLFYNVKKGIIWHTRRPVVKLYSDDYYSVVPVPVEKQLPKEARVIRDLSKSELVTFRELMNEVDSWNSYMKEGLEEPRVPGISEKERVELLEMRTCWQAVLDKL